MKRIEVVIGDHGYLDSSIVVDGEQVLANRVEVSYQEIDPGSGAMKQVTHRIDVRPLSEVGVKTCMTVNIHGTEDPVEAPVYALPDGRYRVEWLEEDGRPVPL
jgi:hypothetical protein